MGGIISFPFINDGSVYPLLKGVIRETKYLENSYICYCGRYAGASKSFHTETFPSKLNHWLMLLYYRQPQLLTAVSPKCCVLKLCVMLRNTNNLYMI